MQVSKEGEVYEVSVAVAKMSTLVATTIDDDAEDEDEVREIPLPNVKNAVLTKVIEYCTHYKDEAMTPIQTPLKSSKIEDMVQPWYANFVKVDQALLFELVTAANFMDIKPLLDLTCLAVSVLIKGKQASELRAIFNISNDFTPEEEAQVRLFFFSSERRLPLGRLVVRGILFTRPRTTTHGFGCFASGLFRYARAG